MVSDYDKLHDELISEFNKPFGKASLSGIKPILFFRTFLKSENARKYNIITLYHLLNNHRASNTNQADLDFASALKQLIDTRIDKFPVKNASGNLLLQLLQEVNDHIKTINMFGVTNN